jgi:hypothetical protein
MDEKELFQLTCSVFGLTIEEVYKLEKAYSKLWEKIPNKFRKFFSNLDLYEFINFVKILKSKSI